jgi:sugar O-acyltransferase (sialic acid O-acetyltransferase NeuD family)
MKKLIIFGLGKIADVAYQHFLRDSSHAIVAFACDREWIGKGQTVQGGPPIVAYDEVERLYPPAEHEMFLALGYHELNQVRARKFAEAKAKGYRLASYVSPRADVGPWFHVGENCLILDGVGIQPGAKVGHNVYIWNNTLIGHHSVIGDDVWIAAGATIGGMVEVGRASFIGLNATLGGEAVLGAESFVGAAALVLKSGPDKSVFVQQGTERFRLDSSQFLRMTRMPTIGSRER